MRSKIITSEDKKILADFVNHPGFKVMEQIAENETENVTKRLLKAQSMEDVHRANGAVDAYRKILNLVKEQASVKRED